MSEVDRHFHLDLRALHQPPNSPGFNVMDLGYFRSIQTLQHEVASCSYDKLVEAEEKSFINLEIEKLENVFLSLELCV